MDFALPDMLNVTIDHNTDESKKRESMSKNRRESQQGTSFMEDSSSESITRVEENDGKASLKAKKGKSPAGKSQAIEPIAVEPTPEERSVISVPLSQSLARKLKIKAQQEGVSVEDFVSELLAEGLVLRAWEIMERKNTMRSGQANNANFYPNARSNNNNNRNFRNSGNPNFNRTRPLGGNGSSLSGQQGGHSNNHRRAAAYNNILEDSANFIEYVRSQEKKQQR